MVTRLRTMLHGNENGFSLAEIVVALSIFSILATVATLQMGRWDKEEKMRAAQSAVSQLLQYTRVQAVTRGMSWSTLNTLTTSPYGYDPGDATLSNYVTKATENSSMGITISPDTISFDARGVLINSDAIVIVISSSYAESRSVNVSTGGMVSIPAGHHSGG